MMAEGVVVAASAGENATASFWREPLLCGSHAFAGGTPLRGAKPCVLGFCVRGVLCVGDRVSWFFANLHLGLGGGGLAGHLLGVSRAGGPLARRVAGLRSTGSAFRGPAVHPSKTPLWRGLQETKAGLARPRFGGVAKRS